MSRTLQPLLTAPPHDTTNPAANLRYCLGCKRSTGGSVFCADCERTSRETGNCLFCGEDSESPAHVACVVHPCVACGDIIHLGDLEPGQTSVCHACQRRLARESREEKRYPAEYGRRERGIPQRGRCDNCYARWQCAPASRRQRFTHYYGWLDPEDERLCEECAGTDWQAVADTLDLPVFSEIAADTLRRDDTALFVLWSLARYCDIEGAGWVDYRLLMKVGAWVFSTSYISRLIGSDDSRRYFWWDGEHHRKPTSNPGWFTRDDPTIEQPDPGKSRRWRCHLCHQRRTQCYCPDELAPEQEAIYGDFESGVFKGLPYQRRLFHKSAAAVAAEHGLGRVINVPLPGLRNAKSRKGLLLAAWFAGLRKEDPISQASIRQRTGISERMQREYGQLGYFEIVRQDARLPVDSTHVNPLLFDLRGAYKRGSEIWIRLPNKYRADNLKLTARRPSRYLRRRYSASRREGSEHFRGGASEESRQVTPNAPVPNMEYRDGRWQWAKKPVSGRIYFHSDSKRRKALKGGVGGGIYSFVRGKDGNWNLVGDMLPITAPQPDGLVFTGFVAVRRDVDIPPGLSGRVVVTRKPNEV